MSLVLVLVLVLRPRFRNSTRLTHRPTSHLPNSSVTNGSLSWGRGPGEGGLSRAVLRPRFRPRGPLSSCCARLRTHGMYINQRATDSHSLSMGERVRVRADFFLLRAPAPHIHSSTHPLIHSSTHPHIHPSVSFVLRPRARPSSSIPGRSCLLPPATCLRIHGMYTNQRATDSRSLSMGERARVRADFLPAACLPSDH